MSKKLLGYAVFVIEEGIFSEDYLEPLPEHESIAKAMKIITKLRDENIKRLNTMTYTNVGNWIADETELFKERKESVERLRSCDLGDDADLIIVRVTA